jgi:hypothetical protein
VRDSVLRRELLLEVQPGAPASLALTAVATRMIAA